MNKPFSEIMYESERLIDDLYKPEQEALASIITGLKSVGDINRESFVNQKNIVSFLQECMTPLMEVCDIIDYNSIPQEIKKKGYELRSFIPAQIKQHYGYNLQTIQRILNSMIELIPKKLDDKEKIKANALVLFRDRATKALFFIDRIIRTKTNLLLSRNKTYKDNFNSIDKDYRFLDNLDGTTITLDKDYEPFSIQFNVFALISCQVVLNYLAMYCTWFHQETYLYYYRPKEMNIDSEEFFSILTKMSAMFAVYDQKYDSLNNKIDTIEKKQNKEFNDLNKKADQLIEKQDNIQIELINQGHKSSHMLEKVEEKVDKRNRADKRKSLTQEECAILLYKQKVLFCKKREDYTLKVGISSTRVKCPKDETMVLRTIQRWDQYLATNGEKGTKPPKGYSRKISAKEFDLWAEVFEQIEYEKWKRKQPMIRRKKYKQDGLVSTHSPEKEDEENLEEEEDDQETRGQGNLVDRVAHKTKRD